MGASRARRNRKVRRRSKMVARGLRINHRSPKGRTGAVHAKCLAGRGPKGKKGRRRPISHVKGPIGAWSRVINEPAISRA